MTDYTAPPTYETLKAMWLKAPTTGASERYDREVNFEMWALEHGIYPTQEAQPSNGLPFVIPKRRNHEK